MKCACILMLLLSLAALPLVAQTTGIIEGTVKDASGAVMPGVNVSAMLAGGGAKRMAVTDTGGVYHIVGLAPG
jgi:hypothetical protein